MAALGRSVAALLGLGLVTAPLVAEAQQAGQMVRIGYLSQGRPELPSTPYSLAAFFRALGWVEGQNFVFDSRYDQGQRDRLPALAAELVERKVSVIFTRGTPAALAAKGATGTTPIVMVFVADAVRSGLVTSLARPGGNVTGMAFFGPDVARKQLEVLKETVPSASTIGVLFDPLNRGQTEQLVHDLPTAATALAVKLHPVKVDASASLETVFSELVRNRAEALLVYPLGVAHVAELANLAIKHRLASATTFRTYAEGGLLMSYSASLEEQYQRAAVYIDKILRGARPGDLPVEQPSRFELVVNRKTANAPGLTLPPALLLRADHVVE